MIPLALIPWRAVALVAIVAVPLAWGGIMRAQRDGARDEVKAATARFDAFRADVQRIGKEQEAKTHEQIARQQQVSRQRLDSLQSRYDTIARAYDRVRNADAGAGGGELPAVPDAAGGIDGAACDSRLFALFEHADRQTARLIELQKWVSGQAEAK